MALGVHGDGFWRYLEYTGWSGDGFGVDGFGVHGEEARQIA